MPNEKLRRLLNLTPDMVLDLDYICKSDGTSYQDIVFKSLGDYIHQWKQNLGNTFSEHLPPHNAVLSAEEFDIMKPQSGFKSPLYAHLDENKKNS